MNVKKFAKGAEKLVDPVAVGKMHYLQGRAKLMPVWLQRWIVEKASKKADKMGFVVEPYAFFLFYEIAEPARVEKYLPEGFAPVRSRAFVGDSEKYYGIVSIFRAHTSAFFGARAEFYAIAENTATGLMSWVILDYISDTISYDYRHGLRSPNAPGAVVTTTCEGEFVAELSSPEDKARVRCEASLLHPSPRALDERLWIDGNTSIAYGRGVGEKDGDLFSLTFMPEEMTAAWEIPLSDVSVASVSSQFPEVFGGRLELAACFPFAQHMLSDAPGQSTHYGSVSALRKAAESVRFSKIRGFGK